MTIALWMTVLLLAFANGANDNAKGVATLRGSGLATDAVAILWGTLWTSFGALLSTQIGVPISTTHALTGALIGTGAAAFGIGPLHLATLGKGIVLPLLLSPLLALGLTLLLFSLLRPLRRFAESCVCLVRREPVVISEQALARSLSAPPAEIVIGSAAECRSVAATNRFTPLNGFHWLSAGLMSFSRGLNDTPKIAALLLAIGSGPTKEWAIGGIALAMAVGGMLGARRVSRTLSEALVRKMVLKIRVRLTETLCLRADLERIAAVKTGRRVEALSETQLASKREIKSRFLTLPVTSSMAPSHSPL